MISYSKALAKSYAANNIINVISPGVIESSVALPVTPIPMQRLGVQRDGGGDALSTFASCGLWDGHHS
ncbi:MAG: hypothetical protein R2865_03125 [Deinococcales bacterium]